MNKLISKVLPACVVLLCALPALAPSYSIDWSTIDGGGGASSGGSYSIGATIGQPDAGAMSGGRFSIAGGFWPGVTGVVAGPLPRLSIRLAAGNDVVLSWPNPSTGYRLQQTANMTAPGGGWTDVTQTPAVIGPYKEVTLIATGRFCMFRLRAQP
jgi:hypothetical protein